MTTEWTWRTGALCGVDALPLERIEDAEARYALLLLSGGGAVPEAVQALLPAELAAALQEDAAAAGRFRGELGETRGYSVYGGGALRYVVVAGVRKAGVRAADALRLAAAAAVRAAVREGLREVRVAWTADAVGAAAGGADARSASIGAGAERVGGASARAGAAVRGAFGPGGASPAAGAGGVPLSAAEAAYAAAEGALLGAYAPAAYKKDSAPRSFALRELRILLGGADRDDAVAADAAVQRALVAADATNYARDLTNLPGNFLTPALLSVEAQRIAEQYSAAGLHCEVLERPQLEKLGMGGLLEVGKGSVNDPVMIVMKYQGLAEWKEPLGLVGKGITFDTGGISLKKGPGMEEMVSDMGGAAVLLGVMAAAAERRLPVNLICVIPAAENMPSGEAYKPGDVITTYSGRTVEVLNTDAEGRIVLADGMTYAKELGAVQLIDVATLTGAVLIALSDVATAAVGNDQRLISGLLESAEEAGERLWQLPSYPEYWEKLNSRIADVKNATSPDKWAGAIMGGLFIGTFADDTPWVHLDTGGTAWLWSERGVDPVGGTGSMVRTLIRYVEKPDHIAR